MGRLTALGLIALLAGCGGCEPQQPQSGPPVATGLELIPATVTLLPGDSTTLVARLLFSSGALDTVTPDAVWSSTVSAVATVAAGVVRGVAAGTATISAAYQGWADSTLVAVSAGPMPVLGPLRVSTRNPRYFETPSGTIVYLTGSHTWSNLRDNGTTDPPPTFDYQEYLGFLEARQHNFFRLWAWEQDKWTAEITNDYWFSAGPYQRTGPGTALDGKPRFDVTQFNDAYFDRVRARVQAAGARGMYVAVMLFDGWSVGTKPGYALNNPWKGHPYNPANNINGIDGDSNDDGQGTETHTLTVAAVTQLQEAYVRRLIDAVNDLDNVLYEISNESDGSSVAWQYHMIDVVRSYQSTKPQQHPVGMTVAWPNGSNTSLAQSAADWVSPNGDLESPPVADGSKVSVVDTDHLCGICGTVGWVWRWFTRGHNPILMDGYDGAAIGLGAAQYNATDPTWEAIRRNLGLARSYALRMDLAAARPSGALASTSYCLAVPGSEYLVFLPNGGTVTVNLTAVTGSLSGEWLNPATGAVTPLSPVAGGSSVSLTPPFGGSAVLYLHR